MPVRLRVGLLSWTKDVLEELEGEVALESCLGEASACRFKGIELVRKLACDRGGAGSMREAAYPASAPRTRASINVVMPTPS